MSDLSEQLAYEKDRADKAEAEIERIKAENKTYEEMLEGESLKKEAEIRKLKEEAIFTGKSLKSQKAEIAVLTTEVATLKDQLANAASSNNTPDPEQLKKAEAESRELKQRLEELKKEVEEERSKVVKLEEIGRLQLSEWERKEGELQEELSTVKKQAEELKKYNNILNEKLMAQQESPQKKPKEDNQTLKQNPSRDSIQIQKYEDKIKHLQEKYRHLEERNRQLEGQCRTLQEALGKSEISLKEYCTKLQALAEQSHQIQQAKPSFSHTPSPQQSSLPSPPKDSFISQEGLVAGRVSYSCLLLTKSHYISPFLEVYEDSNSLQIYKSTRAGCYEKSMGSYRHKFDRLSFDQEAIISPIINSILQSQDNSHHSVIIFGVKRSGKKELMSKIIVRLKDFLMAKLQNSFQCETLFLRPSQEEGKTISEKGNDKRSVVQVINRVIALGYKNEKERDKINSSPRKVQSRPNVCYFSLHADSFRLELGCSSHTNISFRSSTTPTALLNHILYSRLPDVLQSVHAHRHLILTINPIIDLYDECRNTLSTTFCRPQPRTQMDLQMRGNSPIREDLNLTLRRRFDSIQREKEQTQLRTRKLQEDCMYYRARFDELEVRLKGLLNTHSLQSSYLKKSPVTLSYEKLLKFVHSVQAHSAVPISGFNSLAFKQASIYIEKDNESVDAL